MLKKKKKVLWSQFGKFRAEEYRASLRMFKAWSTADDHLGDTARAVPHASGSGVVFYFKLSTELRFYRKHNLHFTDDRPKVQCKGEVCARFSVS